MIGENYQSLLEIWELNNMSTFRDFLEYYNNLDVLPMIEGIERFKLYFVEKGVDVFKDCISVPGAARKMLYKSGFETGVSFALIDKRDEDLYHTIKSNIVGGPSIIFTRYLETSQTNIRENAQFPCKSVLGYDANSLYAHAQSQPMPCGNYVRRLRDNNFKPSKSTNRFTVMYDWLEWMNFSQNLRIKHKMNFASEKRVGPYLVDGYDANTNTIYEFLGCFFHGHSCIKPSNLEQHTQRFAKTQERLSFLRNNGYEIVSIWECEFRKQLTENEAMKCFIDERYPTFYKENKGCTTESQILEGVMQEKLFGFIEVDIQVPDSWDQVKFKPATDLNPTKYFEEMSPLFCTTEVEFESIGEHMRDHALKYGLSTKPRTLLVGGLKAECILLSSPLLKWYIEHGLLVSKIHQFVEFSKQPCFKNFVDTVTYDRRQGDIDKSLELKSSLSKLIGNSAFGGTIINQEKFQRIKYMKGFKKACFAVNNPRFRQLNELGDDMYESEFANVNISINSPTYLGFMILQYAKLHMLSFYYDFMDKFIGREKFEMAEMDTDSCYFGLAGSNLRECVKPDMLLTFDQNRLNYCKDDFYGDQFQTIWFPRECCQKHNKHDTRTPGLMKLEFYGSKIVGLCSKSYVAINDVEDSRTSVKYSLKGVNNQFLDPTDTFTSVLNTRCPVTAVNRGIRCFNNSVFTYSQPKQAFNYFYCKRMVQPDGVHTLPLNITLKPVNKFKEKQVKFEEEIKRLYESMKM